MSMDLRLDQSELADMKEALQAHTTRLLFELARADDRKYRELLRRKLSRFEELSAKVDLEAREAAAEAEPAH